MPTRAGATARSWSAPTARFNFFLLSPARGRGRVRGKRCASPPHLTSPPCGGEEYEWKRRQDMSSDVAEVEKVLQVYFDGLYEGDTQKLGAAFHPMSHLYSVAADGKAADFPRADWFKVVEGRKSAKANG